VHCNFFVLCQWAGRLDTGAPLLHGIFRHIVVGPMPARLDPFFIAFEIEAEHHETDATYLFSLRMIDEDGRVHLEHQLEVAFARRADMGPSYVFFAEQLRFDRPIERPGIYRFDLSTGDRPVGELRFEILDRPPFG
jgi:hypothetical protein